MKYGNQLIKELGKRGLRGYYFSYKQYSQLSKAHDFSGAKALITSWGYDVASANSTSELVDLLSKQEYAKDKKGCLGTMILEPLFWLFLLLFSGC